MKKISRGSFLKTTAAASAFVIMKPSVVFGSKANSQIRLGIIGSGNRGTHVATNMINVADARVVAVSDIFEERLNQAVNHFNRLYEKDGQNQLGKDHLFYGHDAHKRLIDLKDVDAVLVSAPGYVHPEFTKEAIASGKHVYCEKPVAVDVPGVRKMLSAGKQVKKGQSVSIGFQVRTSTPYVEMIRRIRRGDIGEIVSVQLHYYAAGKNYQWPENVPLDKMKIINHYAFNALSGGIFLDQAIHLIDVANWALGTHPLEAYGNGSRKGRDDKGDSWSNYQVNYKYPGNVNVSISSAQIGPEWGDQCARFIGTEGIAEAHFSGEVFIKGKNPWDAGILKQEKALEEDQRTGIFASLYDADINKAKTFINSITSGNAVNEIENGCQSTLSAIMGRDSARSGKMLTWKEVLDSEKTLDHGIDLTQFPANR